MTQLLNMLSDIRIGGPLLYGGLFNYEATLNKRELVSINMCYLAEERYRRRLCYLLSSIATSIFGYV